MKLKARVERTLERNRLMKNPATIEEVNKIFLPVEEELGHKS